MPNDLPDPKELAELVDAAAMDRREDANEESDKEAALLDALARCLRKAEVRGQSMAILGHRDPLYCLVIPLDDWAIVPSPHDTR